MTVFVTDAIANYISNRHQGRYEGRVTALARVPDLGHVSTEAVRKSAIYDMITQGRLVADRDAGTVCALTVNRDYVASPRRPRKLGGPSAVDAVLSYLRGLPGRYYSGSVSDLAREPALSSASTLGTRRNAAYRLIEQGRIGAHRDGRNVTGMFLPADGERIDVTALPALPPPVRVIDTSTLGPISKVPVKCHDAIRARSLSGAFGFR